ncbi:hypothetical protein PN498_05705 [Oscillatoria sp. CS-180]|uniref:hypothetical protein n=1 Tax=Oscillatoria sp. CS-180 TaxID=3021720 RepID=UPI00232C3F8A|nr:hypothetical protein [Oscillatoria sp. CS-180]MDB9525474.1 hypothetical protein [Oscillatoria sp. CS-180]
MLSTLFSSDTWSDLDLGLDLDLDLDSEFLDTTSVLDVVSAFSSDAEEFVVDGLALLETIDGTAAISDGLLGISLTSETGDVTAIDFDVLGFLTNLDVLIDQASGSLSLVEGIVNANLNFDGNAYVVEGFDLATFAAEGFDFLLSSIDTTIPIQQGAFVIGFETGLGPISGVIDIAGGDFNVLLDTPAGDIDFDFEFGADAQYAVTAPTPLGEVDININLQSGNIEIPLFADQIVPIPLSSISGELGLSDGTATIAIDTLIGPIGASFAVDEIVSDFVTDALTGVAVDASLIGGQVDLVASSGTETFETAVDITDFTSQAFGLVSQVEGSVAITDGVVTGSGTVGEEPFNIEQTIASLGQLLSVPIADIPDFVDAIV